MQPLADHLFPPRDGGKVGARITELPTWIKLPLPSSYAYRQSFTLLAAQAARPP